MSTPSVRVSDADRETTASRLQEAFAAGRLTSDELSERLDRAYAARTAEELDALTSDLPAPVAPRPAARAVALHRVRVAAAQSATPFAVCTVIWLATGADGYFWPVWVLIPAVIRMVTALGPFLAGEAPDGERRRRRDRHRDRDRGLPPPPPPPRP